MGITDMITSAVRGHTGLHYVPSFNDFVSGAADDVEALEMEHDRGMPRDQNTPSAESAGAAGAKRTSNKADDLPAMTSNIGADLHKVNRPLQGPGAGRADWIIDNARGGRHAPSVWQYILASQGKEKLPSFDDIVPSPRAGTIGSSELQKAFKVTSEQADAMVAEADQDNDSRINRKEWEDIISSA